MNTPDIEDIKNILVDKYYKGIGLLSQCNLIIYTQKFNKDSFDKPYIFLNEIKDEHETITFCIQW